MHAVPNRAVFCSSLISCFPLMLLRYCLSDFEMVPVAPIITGITFAFKYLVNGRKESCVQYTKKGIENNAIIIEGYSYWT